MAPMAGFIDLTPGKRAGDEPPSDVWLEREGRARGEELLKDSTDDEAPDTDIGGSADPDPPPPVGGGSIELPTLVLAAVFALLLPGPPAPPPVDGSGKVVVEGGGGNDETPEAGVGVCME